MSKITLEKIYEDDDVLVINKPVGLLVHRDKNGSPKEEDTLADILLKEYPDIVEVGEAFVSEEGQSISRPGIVHRLDKDTSGVMIIAKNQETFLNLKEQFQNREVAKTYQLIVYGVLKNDTGEMDWPIGRSRKDPRIRVAGKHAVGKLRSAKTLYKTLERFKGYTLVEAKPETGRTHQIRAHFRALGYPVVGDHLYAPSQSNLPGLERQALHASSLSVVLPEIGKKEFLAPLPHDMEIALDYLKML